MQTAIFREDNLTVGDIDEMAVFGATTFQNDPISIFMNGVPYSDDPLLWEAGFRSELRKFQEIGAVYTLREINENGDKGKLVALATCYTPGNDPGDRPNSESYEGILAKLPKEQQDFRKETIRKQDEAYEKAYPKDFRRNSMHVNDFSVAEEFRGQGYGVQLIKHVVAEAKKEGAETILETSKLDNVHFHEGRGFKLTGEFDIEHYKLGRLPKKYLLATVKYD